MATKMMPGVQTFFQEAGEAACYALAVIKLAERVTGRDFDPFTELLRGIQSGFIHYNWNDRNDTNNFYVSDPAGLFFLLTGKPAVVRKEADTAYAPGPGEYIVQCWERQSVGKLITHFRLPDWDSLVHSLTVQHGRLASLRVFKAGA
jgi:hypothetical protein